MTVFGFIGVGNMGGALARAAAAKLPGSSIMLANRSREKAEKLAAELGAAVSDNLSIAAEADYIFLGVKPQILPGVLAELAPVLAGRESPFVLVSMAAGTSIEKVQQLSGVKWPVIRIMPNTPASIGKGMILYAPGEEVSREQLDRFLELMSGAGRFTRLEERLIDAGSSISGCGPAFADLFIEALADRY